MILHSKPWITEEDHQAVVETLTNGMIAQGAKTKAFEKELSVWVGGKNGIAVASGSAAMQLALFTLEVSSNDEVILPTYVCVSILEAVLSCGAKPVFCDVGRNWIMEAQNIENKISPHTKAIIVPHMYGVFADIMSFKKFGIPVIEDCAQAIGDQSIDKILGDIAVFSFHPTKCFTTGEGGMIVSSKPEILTKALEIRDGNSLKPQKRLIAPMSDIQAALGLSQLLRYPLFIKKRREIVGKYLTEIAAINMKLVNYEAKASSMFFRFPITIEGGLDKYQKKFAENGISIRKGVDQLLHRLMGLSDKEFPVAVELFNTTISIPIYPALTPSEISRCCNSFHLLQ